LKVPLLNSALEVSVPEVAHAWPVAYAGTMVPLTDPLGFEEKENMAAAIQVLAASLKDVFFIPCFLG
jgi:hypothetical protein